MKSGLVVYRAIMGVDEEKRALIFAGHVEEKSKVRISAPRGDKIINHVGDSLKTIMDSNENFKPDIALLFPCVSRKKVLGNLAIKEIEMAYKNIKAPMVGFYAYGR